MAMEVMMDTDKAYEEIKRRRRAGLANETIRARVLEIAPCTKSEILRAMQKGTVEQINEVLLSMMDAGEITVSRHSTGGRPVDVITLAPKAVAP